MLGKQRPHVLDLLGDIRALLICVFVDLKLLNRGLGLLDLGVEAVELRLILRHPLVVKRLLQRHIFANVRVGVLRLHQRLLIEFSAVARNLCFQARNLLL